MVSMLFRDPQAPSSALAALGTLQPRALRSLNCVETLDSVSNYYVYVCAKQVLNESHLDGSDHRSLVHSLHLKRVVVIGELFKGIQSGHWDLHEQASNVQKRALTTCYIHRRESRPDLQRQAQPS